MTGLYPYLIGAIGVLATLIIAYVRGTHTGAAKERNKQLEADAEARDIADKVDNDIGSMPNAEVRKELGKWSAR